MVAELILSNLPAKARIYSLSHWLRVPISGLMPRVTRLYEVPDELSEALYPPGAPVPAELVGILLASLALAAVLVTVRELMPAKVVCE